MHASVCRVYIGVSFSCVCICVCVCMCVYVCVCTCVAHVFVLVVGAPSVSFCAHLDDVAEAVGWCLRSNSFDERLLLPVLGSRLVAGTGIGHWCLHFSASWRRCFNGSILVRKFEIAILLASEMPWEENVHGLFYHFLAALFCN